MSDKVKLYDMIDGDDPGVYPEVEIDGYWVKLEDYNTIATRLAESEQQLTQLKATIQHYEEALSISFPDGSCGKVFELWNNARKSIENS